MTPQKPGYVSSYNVLALVRMWGRPSGLMVGVSDSGGSGQGSSPGWGYCVVFSDLGTTLYSNSASFCPGV